MKSNRKYNAANLILFVGTILFVLVFAEVFLRVLGISYPRTVQRDENLGSAYIPGVEFLQSDEGVAHVKINSEGFRDKEWKINKSPDTFRIALIGDSYTDAFGVPIEARYTEVLEDELNSRCNALNMKKVEVLNFGMSGWGTTQELLAFRHHARKYSPDLVILAFLPYNDIRNNSKSLEKNDGIPYYFYKGTELELDNSFRDTPSHKQTLLKKLAYTVINYSRLMQVVYRANTVIKNNSLQKTQGRENKRNNPLEIGLDENVFHPPTDTSWKEAWHITEGLLSLTRQEVLQDNADFLLVTLTQGTVVHPNEKVRERFLKKLGTKNLFYPQERITEFARQEGIDILNLVNPFQKYALDNQVYLHGFSNTKMGMGHWNIEGHELAGKVVADKVCEKFGGDIALHAFDHHRFSG